MAARPKVTTVAVYLELLTPAQARLLKPYANPKGNLRFPFADPIPGALIARVAKVLAKP